MEMPGEDGYELWLRYRKVDNPGQLGGLPTNDPRVPEVAAWWKRKVDERYRLIPDFGGFEVQANSEGQPEPRDEVAR